MSTPTPNAQETVEAPETDTTPTGGPETDQAPQPSNEPTEPQSTEQTTTEEPDQDPTETVDAWKQHARLWEKRANKNREEAKKDIAEATTRAETAETRAQALQIALENRLNPDDVDLIIGAGDDTKMRALATRLSKGSAPYVPDQGNNDTSAKPDAQREFVRGLFKRND